MTFQSLLPNRDARRLDILRRSDDTYKTKRKNWQFKTFVALQNMETSRQVCKKIETVRRT